MRYFYCAVFWPLVVYIEMAGFSISGMEERMEREEWRGGCI